MRESPLYAITYDLSDDRERSRVAKLLLGFGFRVQKSVFECRLSRSSRLVLFQSLERLGLVSGSVRCYQVYSSSQRTQFGIGVDDPENVVMYIV